VDASFQLNPGEKVGLVGPNGADKTTLFPMVVGEETPVWDLFVGLGLFVLGLFLRHFRQLERLTIKQEHHQG
jgi:ATPase subunit of ABC transporter with duplicated ATPase domains